MHTPMCDGSQAERAVALIVMRIGGRLLTLNLCRHHLTELEKKLPSAGKWCGIFLGKAYEKHAEDMARFNGMPQFKFK